MERAGAHVAVGAFQFWLVVEPGDAVRAGTIELTGPRWVVRAARTT